MATSLNKLLGQFPLYSLLLGVLAGVIYADTLQLQWAYVPFLLTILTLIIWRKHPIFIFIFGFYLGLLTHGSTVIKQNKITEILEKPTTSRIIQIKAIVTDTGNKQTGPYLAKIASSDTLSRGTRILISIPKRFNHTPLNYGDIVHMQGTAQSIEPMRNPHGFDRKKWLYRQEVSAAFIPLNKPEVDGTCHTYRPLRVLAHWKTIVTNTITAGLPREGKEATLIRAVFLGERPSQTSAMITHFRESGTLHVFAVSGLHVGMVGGIIAIVLWFFRLPRWITITGIILGMTLYAGITGFKPPALRAVIMATVFLSGFLVQRKPSLINSLAASAIIVILLDGHQLFTPGFQLSYGVLLAITVTAGFWTRALKPLASIDPFLPRSLLTPAQEFWLGKRQWLSGSLAVSIAAWMGSAPLMWIHFGIITPIAVIAGIPLVCMVFCILAIAMTSLTIGSFWTYGSETMNALNAQLARMTYSTAATFANTPVSHFYRKQDDDQKTHIIVFNLPHGGGAQLIDAGGGILLDSGRLDTFRWHVMPTLSALRINPDSLIISHADVKHSGAMSQCLDHYPVKQALIPEHGSRSPSYREFTTKAEQQACQLIIPNLGQQFQVEQNVFLRTLHAPMELDGKGRADDSGLVLMLHCHGWRIMFTGDAGYETENRMLESGIDLRADVIVMGRNTHDFTGSLEFYQRVQPKVIISTNAYFPERQRISESWLKNVQSINATIFDQKQTGAVTITVDSKSLTLTPTISSREPLTLHR